MRKKFMVFRIIFLPDCFNSSCDLNNPDLCPKSNHTVEFESLLTEVTTCFSNTSDKSNTTCKECTDQYTNLSSFYNKIRLKTSDKFCFYMKYRVGVHYVVKLNAKQPTGNFIFTSSGYCN